MADLSGHDIGRYHMIERLGQGGMATVYKAFDTRLERDVAIKLIRLDAFAPSVVNAMLGRFEREAKSLAKMMHPNIVPIYDYGEHEGSPYLSMAYIPGGTLKSLTGSTMPYVQACRLLAPVAQALSYAHSLNVIHRDVKPANILITATGQPMLLDFGVAKMLEGQQGDTLTGTGVGVGTPEYMAPEQWENQISVQTDIYALGVVFYELVTGRKPYTADTPAAILRKQLIEPLPRPAQFVPDLPETVEKVIYKALAKNPAERYASMGDFAAALDKLARDVDRFQTPTLIMADASTEIGAPRARVRPAVGPQIVEQPMLRAEQAPVPTNISRRPPKKGYTGKLILFGIGCLLTVFAVIFLIWRMTAASALGVGSFRISEEDGMKLLYVPAGEFQMGSTETQYQSAVLACINLGNNQSDCLTWYVNEKPVHTVTLDGFWIDQTEVTNAMYTKCVNAGACRPSQCNDSNFNGNQQPVVCVDWNQAKTYCEWVGRRLPTEAEWEKTARGTDGRIYPWGNQEPDNSLLNNNSNVGKTTDVGSYPEGASPYGTLDMAGNVWEWVSDWYDSNYYTASPYANPMGPLSGSYRIMRGGTWDSGDITSCSVFRIENSPLAKGSNLGFRCAVSAVH